MRHFTSIFLLFSLGLLFSFNAASVQAQCTDLFISEYIEGSGNNKCIEFFNPTAAIIDLSAGDYKMNRYSNGNSSAVSLTLTGSVSSGGTYVVCNNGANFTFTALADQTSGTASWNGDDAISLSKGGVNIDIFGEIGVDPGSQWIVGGNHTANRTLRRNSNISDGNTANDAGFSKLGTDWTEYPQDNLDDLGSHTSDNCPPAVSGCDEVFISEYAEGGSNNKCIEFFNPTAAAIDLNAGDYKLNRFTNGSSSVSASVSLTGSIAAGGTYTVCNGSLNGDFPITADQSSGVCNWTGDDAISLTKSGVDIDIFGEIGVDPGSQWIVGGNRCKDRTLRRNMNITGGNTDNAAGFPNLGTEWTEYPKDTHDGFGTHDSDCMPTPVGCSITSITVMNDGVCDDRGTMDPNDDIFYATIHIEYGNIPLIGELSITGDLFHAIGIKAGDLPPNSVDIQGLFNANGQTISLKAQMHTASGIECQLNETNAGTALPPCSITPDCSFPFFSEYMEGSGNNKCVEIYNPTTSDIDLAAEGYYVSIYSNGSTNINNQSPILLTGTLPASGTYVLCNNNYSISGLGVLVDQLTGNLNFNGDDAVELGNNDSPLDIIGQIGHDPGSQWSSGGVSTKDNTIRRITTVMVGDNFGGDVFIPSNEWEEYPMNTYLGFGSHGSDCGGPSIPSGPWNALNINCTANNSSTYDAANDQWEVTSNCPPDNLHTDIYAFLAQEVCDENDFAISAKVESYSGRGKGGLMIRESIQPQSKFVWLSTLTNGLIQWSWRSQTYDIIHTLNIPIFGAKWLKIEKTGTLYKALVSYDGSSWFPISGLSIDLGNCPTAGFAVQTNNYFPCTFTVSNLELDTGISALASILESGKEAHIERDGSSSSLPNFSFVSDTEALATELEIFPNPAGEFLNINLPSSIIESGVIKILNTSGKTLMTQNFDNSIGTININLGNLRIPGGMYIISVQTAQQIINKQFIKR